MATRPPPPVPTIAPPDAPDPDSESPRFGQVGKHVVIYGVGMVLSKAIGFIMLPIYTRFLTPADYGVMELIQMTLDIVSIVAGARLALGIFRYYHKAETREDKHAVITTALLALGLSYTLVGTVTFFAAGFLSDVVFGSPVHEQLIQLASVAMVFQSFMIVPLAYARMRDRSVLFVLANGAKLIIGLVFNLIFLVGMEMGVAGVFLSSLIANAAIGTVLTWMVIREVGTSVSRRATRDLVRYGVPLIGVNIANFITTFGDRYFLQATGDSNLVGLYTLAYQFGFLLALVGYMPFESIWEPKRFEIAKRADRDEIYARGFIYLNLLLLTSAVGLTLFVGDMLRVMAAPPFHAAAQLVPVILIAYVFQGWTGLQDIGILVRERTELAALGHWTGAVVALIGYAILVPRFMGWGAAAATAIAFAVRHFTIYAISQRLWPVRYRWMPVIRITAIATAVCIASVSLPPLGIVASLALRSAMFAGYLGLVWSLGVLSDEEKAGIIEMAHKGVAAARSLRATATRAT